MADASTLCSGFEKIKRDKKLFEDLGRRNVVGRRFRRFENRHQGPSEKRVSEFLFSHGEPFARFGARLRSNGRGFRRIKNETPILVSSFIFVSEYNCLVL